MNAKDEAPREDRPCETSVWTPARTELWRRIERHDFETDAPFNFTKRLARDKGWTLDETRTAIAAYRRFCFLAMVAESPVTPSETIDEVWHQHLIYTRDYWDVWCKQALGRPLHHDPTMGGAEAQQYFRRQYAKTMALHQQYFGAPDPELWPATHVRFGRKPRYLTCDRTKALLAPRPGALLRKLLGRRTP